MRALAIFDVAGEPVWFALIGLLGKILAVALAYLLVRHWDVSIHSKQRYNRESAQRKRASS